MISPNQKIEDRLLKDRKIYIYLKRDDKLHPEMSGNKFRKLKYNVIRAKKEGHDTLLTFGGAFSNHIYAVAAAGPIYGFKTIGIIRGERHAPLNPTLAFAEKKGMMLEYVSRSRFRNKDKDFHAILENKFGRFYMIPDGGANQDGVRGCQEIIGEHEKNYDFITVCCGTGATLAGIITGLDGRSHAIGFPVIKGGEFLKEEINDMVHWFSEQSYQNWHLETGYHFGGYARFDESLIHFINQFKRKHGIQLDPVYTGKMMLGLYDMIKKGYFDQGVRILAIHSGGLQGIDGFNKRFGDLIKI